MPHRPADEVMTRFVDERVVLAVIGLNLAVAFGRAFPGLPPALADVLAILDYICLLYFVLEIALEIGLQGPRRYFSVGVQRFDFVIVAASLPSVVTVFTETTDLHVLLLLRATRLFQLVRVFRFIPHVTQLWAGIGRALRASVGLLLGLVLLALVLSLIAHHLFAAVAPNQFGDPLTSLYTMFQVFTMEGWTAVPDALAPLGPIGTVAKVFFMAAVLLGGVLGVGIVNAVFVDEMVLDNTDDLEGQIRGLRQEMAALRSEQAELVAALRLLAREERGER